MEFISSLMFSHLPCIQKIEENRKAVCEGMWMQDAGTGR